jgi:hypothetical protein
MGLLRLFTRALGESMSFGIATGGVSALLERFGFTDIEAIDGPGLARLYAAIGNRPMAGGAGIAVARVPVR